ncbi:Various environmental stresses-induced protein Ves [Dethiosulfatibacter aminovorans DSM 17477]|uniref:Various environmental stresses-induced protein Ves n=1 Tax=Dethiosulfatibacter aminovorans DSM 17477 TaxID=1121476 RepID=A0A1M6KU18_9FIRM|nr:HutD family protein [Dethiosulfatibacter aminovorans]SHJ62518.1 Various environmental stresses-induced protein Ves [Dethiosulfatibacter aminovorans DSM 17477]
MKLNVIRKEELVVNKWSGGTTTQIAIYPEDAEYKKLDFLWRISSARVEAEKSEFTPLPGVERILIILDGELRLEHKGHHSKEMKKYSIDFFSGSWETTSEGKVTDFNVMTREGCSAKADIINMGDVMDEIPLVNGTNIFFCSEGEMELEINRTSLALEQGDTLIAEVPYDDCAAEIKGTGNATCINVKITYNK